MKKSLAMISALIVLALYIVGFVLLLAPPNRVAYATNCAGVACGNWAHRLSGNGLPIDCKMATKWLVFSSMQYDVQTPSPLPPPFNAPIEVIWNGRVQPGAVPAGASACPAYIENGAWH